MLVVMSLVALEAQPQAAVKYLISTLLKENHCITGLAVFKFIFNRKSDCWREASDPRDDFRGRGRTLLFLPRTLKSLVTPLEGGMGREREVMDRGGEKWAAGEEGWAGHSNPQYF